MARLGTVGPSRVQLTAPQPRQADLFGGLQGALGRRRDALLVNEDTSNAVEDAQLERDLKLARSRALVGLTDTKSKIELEQAELAKSYDPAGVDFRRKSDEITDRYMLEFRETLPPDLQPEFDPEIATYRNNRSATAYNVQYEMEGANYKSGLADLQKKALDSIFLGNSTIEDWTPVLQNYFDNSPLSESETEALVNETNRNLESMEFARQAEDETTNWIEYNGATADGMPQGMPGYAVGLMGAITATESGGAYNILNGGETFSDFSDHPRRVGAGGTSTAAGKYQFVEGTWDLAKKALNLPDFSPASQEKAAWWLANRDYLARTGRNLEADLASGDPVMIENVRKVLGGQGDENVTWKGLQHLSAQEFFAYVTGGKAVPPGIMNDPNYSSLTEPEKANMLMLAQKQSNENLANLVKMQNQQRDMLVGQMKTAIAGGAMTQQQLTDFISTQPVTPEQTNELVKLFGEHNADESNLGKFSVALQTGGAMFGPDERKGFDVLYARESSKEVGAQNQDYMNSTLLPFVGRSGVFPEQMVIDLTNMARGSDQQRSTFAWQNLALLAQQNAAGFRKAFGEDMASDVEFFRQRSNYYPAPEVMQQMMDARDPTKKPVREVIQKEVDTYVKDNSRYFKATKIMDQIGVDISVTASDPGQLSALESEFLAVFTSELGRYRNGNEAYEAAKNRIASKWGAVSYGGTEPYLMRNPPSVAGISPIGGSLDWVDTYARETTGLDSFRLGSDHVTEAEINSGAAPSYLIMEDYGNGVFLPKVNAETGLPQRLVLDPPDSKEQSLDAELWFRNAYKLDNAVTQMGPTLSAMGIRAFPLVQAARNKLFEAKPKYASSDGLMALNDPSYSEPTDASSEADIQAALTAFKFKTVDEFVDFMGSHNYTELLERLE